MRSLSSGVVLTVAAGFAALSCDTGQGPPPTAASVVVTPAVVSLPALADTVRLTARATDARGKTLPNPALTWSSSAPGVASVNQTGLVTAVSNGAAIITATSDGASGMAGATVAQKASTVTVAPATASLEALGKTVQLSADAKDANGYPVPGVTYSWTSSHPGVATVDASGLVSAVGSGTTTITATADGKGGGAVVSVAQATTSVTLAPVTTTLTALGATAQLTATAKDATGHSIADKTFIWSSSAGTIATVSNSGLVTAVANGTATISAGSDGVVATADVTVAQQLASVSVTPATTTLDALGATAQLVAAAQDANGHAIAGKTLAWASSAGSVASVDNSGLVTAVANGTASITATTQGMSGSSAVTVAQKAATIELSPIGKTLTGVGATQPFTLVARDAGGSLIPAPDVHANWTSLNPNVATMHPVTGLASAVGSGQVVVRVNVDGVVGYATLTVMVPGLAPVNLWARLESGITNRIEGLWGTSATDVYAAAHGSNVLHYDGTQWRHVFGGIPHGGGVWGSSAQDVYAVGDGRVAHYDGTFWSMVLSGTSHSLASVWGSSPRDIFSVCWDGTVVHFDGKSWASMGSPAPGIRLYGVWGASAKDVYAVGDGRAFHYDGTSWSEVSSGLTRSIESVWGVSKDDIYAAFGRDVFHYNGTAWTRIAYDVPMHLDGIWGSSGTDIYFAGADTLGRAAVLHYDGNQTWSLTRSPLPHALVWIWGAPTGEVFAAGDGGIILRGYRNGTMGLSPSTVTFSGSNNRVQLTALPGAGGSLLTGVPVNWSSSDPSVATVDEEGWVTGVASGTATIFAIAFGGAGATANVTVDLSQHPPVAVIDSPSQDTLITLGEGVDFRGTGSDVDGTIAGHTWDFGDGGGSSVEDPGAHTYAATGIYRVTYRVTDNDGMSSPQAVVMVTVVANQIPTATITSPANQATFAPGATITFTGSGTDHEDGVLAGAALVWHSSLDGQIGTGSSFTRSDLSLGTHRITLIATDSQGTGGTAEVTISVSTISPIEPGEWHGSTTGMALDFTVSPDAQYVTQLKYTFSGLKCGGAELVSGSVIVSRTPGYEITNRQFVIAPTGDQVPDITGSFGDNGTTVSGTWTWLTCSGTWTGSR